MSIDPQWSTRSDRGFTWWPHRLHQTVDSSVPTESLGATVCRIQATTPVLQHLPDSGKAIVLAALANRQASFSALVVDPDRHTAALTSTAYIHSGKRWIGAVFKAAAAFQATQMDPNAEQLGDALGGSLVDDPHPQNGRRPEPDDLLALPGWMAAQGEQPLGATSYASGACVREVPIVPTTGMTMEKAMRWGLGVEAYASLDQLTSVVGHGLDAV